jgi:N-acetylmuramoyl-L-alanine amidase
MSPNKGSVVTTTVTKRAYPDERDMTSESAGRSSPEPLVPLNETGVQALSGTPGQVGPNGLVAALDAREPRRKAPAAIEPLRIEPVASLIEPGDYVSLPVETDLAELARPALAVRVTSNDAYIPYVEKPGSQPSLPETLTEQVAPPQDYGVLFQESGVRLASLFGLEVRTVVIDPGHGGRDPGARGPSGLAEKDVTLDIARQLKNRLERRPGFNVLMTRDSDSKVTLRQRVEFANSHAADVLVSIHVNYLPQEPPTIVETYYFGPQSDEAGLELARLENQGSEYSMGAFSKMINRIGDTFRHQESRTLAHAIQSSLYRNLRSHNKRIQNVGIKTAPFVVLLGAEMPSVLAEVTCISNREEERRLATPEYRKQIAAYLEEGITKYLRDRRHTHVTTEARVSNDGESTEQGG